MIGLPGGASWLSETAEVFPKGKNHCMGATYVGWFIVMTTELRTRRVMARHRFLFLRLLKWQGQGGVLSYIIDNPQINIYLFTHN